MTLSEARKILGLGTDDDPRPILPELKEARERIAEVVRTAPNETLAARYQQGLIEFDQALAAVREHLESQGLLPRPEDPAPLPEVPQPHPEPVTPPAAPDADAIPADLPAEPPEPAAAEHSDPLPEPAGEPFSGASYVEIPEEDLPVPPPLPPVRPVMKEVSPPPEKAKPVCIIPKSAIIPPPKKVSKACTIWSLILLLLAIGGGLFYLKTEDTRRLQRQARIVDLEGQALALVKERRWPEATATYAEIEKLSPGSRISATGRRSIEAGITEEQNQFIGYWSGQAKASFDAGRWDEAEAATRQVLGKFPHDKEAAELLSQIAGARSAEADRIILKTARGDLQQRKWDAAIDAANKILSHRPADEDAKSLLKEALTAKEKAAADLSRAKGLLEQARAKDQGQYDPQVLAWLREANSLAPEDTGIKAYLEKIASYSRTLRVPGDFATPAEALAQARDRDRIIIAAGVWDGALSVNASVDIQGAGPDATSVRCDAKLGNAIILGPAARGSRISGITFQHFSFDHGPDRFSTALVRGATVDFVDCRFSEGSGHGLAVIEGGHAIASRCRFSDNAWNGIAASGAGSLLEIRQSECLRNFGHGIESWDGAAIILTGNRCEENSGNGIHADNGSGSVTLENNQFTANREFGLVLSSAGSGRISGNAARGNLLGGYVIRGAAAEVSFSGNEASRNEGPGLVLDIGLAAAGYKDNSITGNAGQQVMVNANLSAKDPGPSPGDTPPRAVPVDGSPE